MGATIKPGCHQFLALAQVHPAAFDANDVTGAFNDTPQMGSDGALVSVASTTFSPAKSGVQPVWVIHAGSRGSPGSKSGSSETSSKRPVWLGQGT